jgi:protoheme IX farnesyltransferase
MSYSVTQTDNATWRAYLELCKPRVVALMMLTTLVGMCLASPGMVPIRSLVWGNIGIALAAGAAAVINQLVDARIDAVMQRTKQRPIPTGKITTRHALTFAFIIGGLGLGILVAFVNWLTAVLTLFTLLGYAVVYTMFLKRATPQNIVIGGLAGAAPPLLGWTAVTGSFDPNSLLLVLIIYAWTPPHFWALAIHREKEYAKADIPMLPVTHGIRLTKLHILLYTLLMIAASVMPFITRMSGWLYLVGALLLGGRFLYWAIRLLYDTDSRIPMRTFRFSIFYLMGLFIFLLLDHYWKVNLF